jgi:Domain of unknown function (DUF397)
MNSLNWRKASYSGGSSGSNCVEVASSAPVVLVRDTAARDGAALAFTASAWSAFTAGVRQN